MNSIFHTAVLTLLLVVAPPALSQTNDTAIDPLDGERYILEKSDGGFVRLNRRTGQTSFCKVNQGNLICRMSADERAAYEAEIGDLNKRITRLEQQMSKIEVDDTDNSSPNTGEKLQKKSAEDRKLEEEFDKAMEFAQDAMRRFFDVVKELKDKHEEPK